MTASRIAELGGCSRRITIKVDGLLVAGVIALAWACFALVLDLRPELLAALLRLVRG
jgi:hypothetical protein